MKKSIARNIRFSLLGYTLFTVLLLWLFQIIFLNTYYQAMQKASVIRVGAQIAAHISDDNFEDTLEQLSFSHRMCSLVIDENGRELYSIDMLGRGCIIHSPARISLVGLLAPLLNGEKDEVVEQVRQARFHNESIIYAKAVTTESGQRVIILINAVLDPVGSTRDILKSQLIIISAVLAALALVISRLVAVRLSRPIRRITSKAKRLADGVYTADYDGGGIEEIDELAETLNFSAKGLSRVEELRRELVANVSHDLKTPLTMIKAYAEMIRDLTGSNKAKRDGQLDIIISETDRLTALVTDLINVSRNESEKKHYVAQPFDLSKMLADTVARFSQICPEHRLTLTDPGCPAVTADRDSIGQVLYNLLSNAVNYTGEDKSVSVSACPGQDGVRVEIRDTGCGIPPEEIPLIWERYYRSGNTHQRPVAGSGLGLSIVRSALSAQELPFGVESAVGEGSCFWFVLPAAPPDGADEGNA